MHDPLHLSIRFCRTLNGEQFGQIMPVGCFDTASVKMYGDTRHIATEPFSTNLSPEPCSVAGEVCDTRSCRQRTADSPFHLYIRCNPFDVISARVRTRFSSERRRTVFSGDGEPRQLRKREDCFVLENDAHVAVRRRTARTRRVRYEQLRRASRKLKRCPVALSGSDCLENGRPRFAACQHVRQVNVKEYR